MKFYSLLTPRMTPRFTQMTNQTHNLAYRSQPIPKTYTCTLYSWTLYPLPWSRVTKKKHKAVGVKNEKIDKWSQTIDYYWQQSEMTRKNRKTIKQHNLVPKGPTNTHGARKLPTSSRLLYSKERNLWRLWEKPIDQYPSVSYGDCIHEKHADTIRSLFQNVKGLMFSIGLEDHLHFVQNMNLHHTDIAVLSATNTAWQHVHLQAKFRNQLRKWYLDFQQKRLTNAKVPPLSKQAGIGQWLTAISPRQVSLMASKTPQD